MVEVPIHKPNEDGKTKTYKKIPPGFLKEPGFIIAVDRAMKSQLRGGTGIADTPRESEEIIRIEYKDMHLEFSFTDLMRAVRAHQSRELQNSPVHNSFEAPKSFLLRGLKGKGQESTPTTGATNGVAVPMGQAKKEEASEMLLWEEAKRFNEAIGQKIPDINIAEILLLNWAQKIDSGKFGYNKAFTIPAWIGLYDKLAKLPKEEHANEELKRRRESLESIYERYSAIQKQRDHTSTS